MYKSYIIKENPRSKKYLEERNNAYIENGKIIETRYEDYQDWKSAFVSEGKIIESAYEDPDVSSIAFYKDLALFLEIREKKLIKEDNQYSYTVSLDPFGIKVTFKNKIIFYLKSDQLGFSATKGIYLEYINKAEEKQSARKVMSKWIYDSRCIGGSFLWPMEQNNEKKWITNPQYNKTRGTGKMQDRADLTLLDIRNCYCKKCGWLWNQYNTRINMKEWLDHFGCGEEGFNKYIEFFCFSSFVKDTYPKDMTEKNEKVIENFDDEKHSVKFAQYELKDIHVTLTNLNTWINERSDKMERVISENIIDS